MNEPSADFKAIGDMLKRIMGNSFLGEQLELALREPCVWMRRGHGCCCEVCRGKAEARVVEYDEPEEEEI